MADKVKEKEMVECPDCDGSGVTDCPDCEPCGTCGSVEYGEINCDTCSGTGEVEEEDK